jgi:hypothetical protein
MDKAWIMHEKCKIISMHIFNAWICLENAWSFEMAI